MLTSHRRALILLRLGNDGKIDTGDLAAELQLSEDIICRDLREMAVAGLVRQVHGGALPIAPPLPWKHARKSQLK
ncbi:DeoR family transcriptional regulator [Rhizobium sp. LjRoot98]|uniref:DeoR family transcriptional regulator n=1 Tax=Rhizobium sp. LjRoot98 TaxID=3342345 RepID=UPI003ECFC987